MSENGKARREDDVSPMEARNEGQGRKGGRSSDAPLSATGKTKAGKKDEPASSAVARGGEDESRDDL